jgi:hypothetical protein
MVILCCAIIFKNPNNQSINWTYPYFSGAANFTRLFDWKISPSDFERANEVAPEDYQYFKHQRTDDLVPNTVNNYGYVLVALVSQALFPFLGDLQGVVLLQLVIHICAAIFMMLWVLQTSLQRYGFLFLYAANPLVIHITTFPFYYFWLFVPSFAFAVLILKPNWRHWFIVLALPILLLSLLIRPTTVFLAVLFFLVAFFLARSTRERYLTAFVSVIFFATVIYIFNLSSGSPWHTMYVGIGAYPNNVGVADIGDHRGYEYFYGQTGIKIDTDAVRGNWNSSETRKHYSNTLKVRYLAIAADNPVLLARNAFVNMLQVFSVGHIVDRPMLSWLSTALGFFVLCFLVYTRQIVWVLAVLASAMSFAWYFPPIPAYNFSAYLLVVVSGLLGLESIVNRWYERRVGVANIDN